MNFTLLNGQRVLVAAIDGTLQNNETDLARVKAALPIAGSARVKICIDLTGYSSHQIVNTTMLFLKSWKFLSYMSGIEGALRPVSHNLWDALDDPDHDVYEKANRLLSDIGVSTHIRYENPTLIVSMVKADNMPIFMSFLRRVLNLAQWAERFDSQPSPGIRLSPSALKQATFDAITKLRQQGVERRNANAGA